ncbi:MAG: extracellular solute-binding protein [Clostridia bacterium]|nr:extracellular solute-binding protein [Clostridia bacterium]
MKKILCGFLALLTVCASLAACGESGKTPTGSDGVDVTAAEELPDIELTGDYGGAEFNILSAGNVAYGDFTAEEDASTALGIAQYQCKTKVESDYNIKINETQSAAYSSGGGPGFIAINKSVTSGDCDYDLALIAGYDVSVLAYSGYLYDMNSVPGVNLKKSWWDQRANESLNVRGVMFFTTGDITVSDNNATFCMMFNKELARDYDLESPYDLVYDNKWTIENFGKLCKTVTEDLNQDGVMNENDRYGLLVWDDSIVGMVNAAGERCCTINDDGKIELTFYSERTLAALEQYTNIAYDRQYALTYQRYVKSGVPLWQNDQGLFFTAVLGNMPGYREMESDFGILPYPKLDETQESYHSTVAPYNSQFICVPLIQNDIDRTGVITEALAYYGQKIVLPAYYDVTLIGQSSRDEESEGMVDIILDTMTFDIGYYYQVGPYNKQLILALRNFDNNFASMYDTYKNSAQALLDVINQYYGEAVEEWIEK